MRFFLGLIIVLSSGAGFADVASDLNAIDANRERRQVLEQKETGLRIQHRNLEILNGFFARSKYLRDYAILGDNGAVKLTDQWVSGVQGWILQWDTLAETLKGLNDQNVNESASEIEKIADDFFKQFKVHETSAQRIMEGLQNTGHELQLLQDLPNDIAPSYDPQVNAFKKHHQDLKALHATLLKNFQADRLQLLSQSIRVFRTTVLTRVRQILVKYPELESVLDQTQKLLDLMEQQGERIAKLEKLAVDTRGALTQGKYFLAEESLAQLKGLKDELNQEISATRYGARNSDFYLSRLNASFNATQAQWDSVMGLQTKYTIFYKFFTSQRTALSADCRNRSLIPKRNCEKLRPLNQIKLNLQRVKTMNDQELSYIEEQLIKVRENRS